MIKDIHDQTIDYLIEQHVTRKSVWEREVHLSQCAYECDLYIFNNNNLNIYEIKTTDGKKQRKKAYQQLKHDIIYVPKRLQKVGISEEEINKIYTFYVHDYNTDRYKEELIEIINLDLMRCLK